MMNTIPYTIRVEPALIDSIKKYKEIHKIPIRYIFEMAINEFMAKDHIRIITENTVNPTIINRLDLN